MARSIRWTSLVLKDLAEIREYIQRDKVSAARQEAARIKRSTEKLARFPQSGRALEKIPGVREIVSGNYRIFYRVHSSGIEILRVYHGRRNIPFIS